MDGTPDDILSPVSTRAPRKPTRSALDIAVAASCASVALMALVIAIIFTAGFAMTDLVAVQIGQAAALGAGVAALAVVPFALVAWWAWKGWPKRAWTALLMLPWVAMGAFWIAVSDYDWILGAVPALVASVAVVAALLRAPASTFPATAESTDTV